MENKWIKQGGNFKIVPSSISVEDNLPVGIYSISQNPMSGELSLDYVADKFEFDFELLGLEQKFIDHALKSYENTTGNFGILLNGVKGTGKSVTAKILANTLNQPVILVDTAYDGIDSFLAGLNFKCVLFFDEFEKNFDPKQDVNILTIMDGVYNCCERKVFILTTNELRINDCLLSRPSRIRYKKEFTNISIEVINHLFDHFLVDQGARDLLFNFVITLETCSVDIIKSLITEINIHGKDEFEYIKSIFNVKASSVTYHIVTAYGTYYDYDKNELHMRSRNEALVAINRYMTLYDKCTRTEEEEKEFKSLKNQELYYRYNECFPCRLWDLKVGMFLHGDPIVEILEDSRIVITKDNNNNFSYHYVIPTYTYNAYTGNVLI